MKFFENYDFFNFQLFNINFTMILDKNFMEDCWLKVLPSHPHAHETWELYFVKRGTLWLDCNQNTIVLNEGQFTFVAPNTEHHILKFDPNPLLGSIRFTFSYDHFDTLGSTVEQLLLQSALCTFDATPEITANFLKLKESYCDYTNLKDREIWIQPKFTANCLQFITGILETAFDLSSVQVNRYIQRKDLRPMIIEFFMYYASKDFTISDLAESLNYSVSQTNRILQQLFGKSFRTLMNETRVKKAKFFLERSDFSISKISDLLGFTEPKNFSKSFKIVE